MFETDSKHGTWNYVTNFTKKPSKYQKKKKNSQQQNDIIKETRIKVEIQKFKKKNVALHSLLT